MTLEKKRLSQEKLVPNLIIERSTTPREGFLLARDFFHEIATEYPNLGYPREDEMDPFNPDRKDRNTDRAAVTYVARVNDIVAGVLTGEEISGEEEREDDTLIFRAQVLLVDPKFQHTQVARCLMEQLQTEYDSVVLSPVPLGGKVDWSRLHRGSRYKALRMLYHEFGFHDRKNQSGMIWRKESKKDKI